MSTRSDRPDMRPFGGLASWPRAVAVGAELAVPIGRTETLHLAQAAGRIVAAAAAARVDVPGSDRAAMDGYAVRAVDAVPGTGLPIVGRVAAGEPPPAAAPPPGSCVEIATGASMPPGTDAVVQVEATRRDGDVVWLQEGAAAGRNVARRGEDLQGGQAVARPGDLLHAPLIAACAAAGITEVRVYARPRVLVAPTGDEVVALGGKLGPGQVFDSNATGLLALLGDVGAEAAHAGVVVDDVDELERLLRSDEHDLVVTVGGTSVGRRDLVSEAMRRAGETLIHGVAVKPGKPLLLGRVGGRPIVGLPGFPTTCMMLGYAVLDPMVRRMGHRAAARPQRPGVLGTDVTSIPDKVQLLPVRLADDVATPTFRASSSISSMAYADGWIEIPAETTHLEAGTGVRVTLF